MVQAWVVKGHLVGPRTVQLDEPVPLAAGEVEVILRAPLAPTQASGDSLAAFLRGLPPGSRTKADIDRQLAEERDSWS